MLVVDSDEMKENLYHSILIRNLARQQQLGIPLLLIGSFSDVVDVVDSLIAKRLGARIDAVVWWGRIIRG
jgi:hypothetical protein